MCRLWAPSCRAASFKSFTVNDSQGARGWLDAGCGALVPVAARGSSQASSDTRGGALDRCRHGETVRGLRRGSPGSASSELLIARSCCDAATPRGGLAVFSADSRPILDMVSAARRRRPPRIAGTAGVGLGRLVFMRRRGRGARPGTRRGSPRASPCARGSRRAPGARGRTAGASRSSSSRTGGSSRFAGC